MIWIQPCLLPYQQSDQSKFYPEKVVNLWVNLLHKKSMTYSGHRKLLCKLSNSVLFLQIPPRENWFQYVSRVYATAINFPCSITLVNKILERVSLVLFQYFEMLLIQNNVLKKINLKRNLYLAINGFLVVTY